LARKKKINPMNTRSNKQLLYGHALTHSKTIKKSWGKTRARREHARLVKKMKKRGMKHKTPFR